MKRTYRVYSEERLQLRQRKKKKLDRPRMPIVVPVAVDIRWSKDFVCDQLSIYGLQVTIGFERLLKITGVAFPVHKIYWLDTQLRMKPLRYLYPRLCYTAKV